MGANVGTTITSWLLSLASIESSGNFVLELLKPSSFSPILAFIGIILYMFTKKQKNHDVGGILLGFAKYLADNKIVPERRVWAHVTVYEEVGHGGSASVPAGITEAISVDMGCVGDGLQCTEKQVSICAKDSGGPYSYEVVGKLIDAAKKMGADYAVDVYPFYGSDVEATLRSGVDIRHGLIGSGVYASHGYERSHIDGVYNTLKVLCGYLDV